MTWHPHYLKGYAYPPTMPRKGRGAPWDIVTLLGRHSTRGEVGGGGYPPPMTNFDGSLLELVGGSGAGSYS